MVLYISIFRFAYAVMGQKTGSHQSCPNCNLPKNTGMKNRKHDCATARLEDASMKAAASAFSLNNPTNKKDSLASDTPN